VGGGRWLPHEAELTPKAFGAALPIARRGSSLVGSPSTIFEFSSRHCALTCSKWCWATSCVCHSKGFEPPLLKLSILRRSRRLGE
jgi:hypothetical protein